MLKNTAREKDWETAFSRIKAEISPKALGRGEIVAVIVQNPLTNADGSANASEIFVGSASNMIYHMIPGQESPMIYAEDLKDVYLKLNFPFPNPNGGILTAAVFTPGAGYTAGDVLTLDPGVVGTNATITLLTVGGPIATAALNNGGAGYLAGEILQVNGGNTFGRITIDTVDGGGAILTFHLSAPGANYQDTIGNAMTGGSGLGATFDINTEDGILTFNITTPGTGFVGGGTQEITPTGGTGAAAVIEIETVETVTAESADICLFIFRYQQGGKQ